MAAIRTKWFQMKMMIWWTLLGVGLGVLLGGSLYNAHLSSLTIELLGYPGELLIRALQELVLPLMVFALMSGVFNLHHSASGTGQIIRWSLLYYLLSMLLAVALGIVLVYAIRPGRSSPFNGNNIVGTCGNSNVATFYFVWVSRNITFQDNKLSLSTKKTHCNDIFMKIIYMVIALTPVGVASLLASTILKSCNLMELLQALALYVSTVLLGLCVHSLVLLPITILLLCQQNPFKIFRQFMPALLMGLGTSSSAASMPVTMQCAEEYGCASSIVRFVIPMGTSMNRDGAALYEAVSVILFARLCLNLNEEQPISVH